MEAENIVDENIKHIGKFMRMARLNSGHTIDALAAKAGLSNQTITNMEFSKGAINLKTLLAAANSLSVKITLNIEKV